jgi:hypothetical protein
VTAARYRSLGGWLQPNHLKIRFQTWDGSGWIPVRGEAAQDRRQVVLASGRISCRHEARGKIGKSVTLGEFVYPVLPKTLMNAVGQNQDGVAGKRFEYAN